MWVRETLGIRTTGLQNQIWLGVNARLIAFRFSKESPQMPLYSHDLTKTNLVPLVLPFQPLLMLCIFLHNFPEHLLYITQGCVCTPNCLFVCSFLCQSKYYSNVRCKIREQICSFKYFLGAMDPSGLVVFLSLS